MDSPPKYENVSFTHPHLIPNLYECLSSLEHQIRYFEEYW